MIFTECVSCDEPFAVPLQEEYLEHMENGMQFLTKHECEKCGSSNYVEHRRIGGETINEATFLERGGKK